MESFDGPYDLWEEAAKEALELVLDAANQPMILLDRFVRGFELYVHVRGCFFVLFLEVDFDCRQCRAVRYSGLEDLNQWAKNAIDASVMYRRSAAC